VTRTAQRPPVSVRYPSEETETEARTRAARKGVTLNAYVVARTSGRTQRWDRAIATPYILEQLRELDEMLAEGEPRAARERIARLRETLG
jgi:hypothetical protein